MHKNLNFALRAIVLKIYFMYMYVALIFIVPNSIVHEYWKGMHVDTDGLLVFVLRQCGRLNYMQYTH